MVASKTAKLEISTVDLRFGATLVPKVRRDVARLTSFPTPAHPAAVLLGVRSDRKAAVFQIATDVTVTGNGTCVPRKVICTQLVLKPGQRALLTRTDGKRLRLELVGLHTTATAGLKATLKATLRQSPTGRCAYDAVAAYEYDAVSGTLHRADHGVKCHYTVIGATKLRAAP